jgi:CheY-like chemotaxis protein
VRRVGERTLSHLGYAVHCTEDGEDAVRLYKEAMEAGQPYDAVILDLTVPGAMGGLDALEELQNIDPDVCAIASSGYATNPVMADYESYGFKGGLTKPYTPDKVGTVLSQVLQD